MDKETQRKIDHLFQKQIMKNIPEIVLMAQLVIFSQENRDTEAIKKEIQHRRRLNKWLDEYGTWHKGQAPYGADAILEQINKMKS
jgi:hypothetical protein